ncbi:Uncharacterised protein [Mycobacteroides abscessus subsp. abscessus]|nr:Uncharacterised protein [Mycobacteroides abscessus subsp. abscessus]
MPSTIADMGNNLLDFVMALVRDQDMAAQYAANPERVIADAHLDGVQPSDVSALIPVVSESMPSISQLAAHPVASGLGFGIRLTIYRADARPKSGRGSARGHRRRFGSVPSSGRDHRPRSVHRTDG